jgi:DUF4097 and DUF4098 domain-containing protein YvlB
LLLAAGASAQKPVDRTIWVAPGGFVRIYNMVGSVRVYGWDRDSLQIQGTVQEPPAGEFVVSPGKQGAKVSVWGPTEIGVKPTDLIIRVPRRSQVWIKTQSATISVQDFEGGLDLVSVTGTITVNGRPRELYAESMGGDLKLAVTTRSARAKTGTGTITLNGSVDDATLTTVSGALSVFNSRITQGHFESVEAQSATGLFNTDPEFINHSGDVELNVPVNANVNVSIDLFSGSFKDEFGVKAKQMAGKLKTRLFSFQIGEDLGADVAVKSFKGTVIVRKAPALKTVQ